MLRLFLTWVKKIHEKFYFKGYEDGVYNTISALQREGILDCMGVNITTNQDTGRTDVNFAIKARRS